MNRTDRLTGIILALRGGRQTAAQLAARFEVSRRTILRDVDALGQIGVPVVALPGAGGGLALAEGYWLPPLHLSVPEATVLLLGLHALGDAATSPFGAARRDAEEKLRAALRPEVLAAADRELAAVSADPPRFPVAPDHFAALRRALDRRGWVAVTYRSTRRVAAHTLLPRRLYAADGRWYCAAISLETGSRRVFRVDRMERVAPVPDPAGAAAALAAAETPGPAYDDPAHPEVAVRLTRRGLLLAEDGLGRDHVPRPLDPETWEVRFRCPPAELPYYARAVYALGPEARALAPPRLRALVRDMAAASLAAHADPVDGDGPVSPSPR